jgi:hypothetical protein
MLQQPHTVYVTVFPDHVWYHISYNLRKYLFNTQDTRSVFHARKCINSEISPARTFGEKLFLPLPEFDSRQGQ